MGTVFSDSCGAMGETEVPRHATPSFMPPFPDDMLVPQETLALREHTGGTVKDHGEVRLGFCGAGRVRRLSQR